MNCVRSVVLLMLCFVKAARPSEWRANLPIRWTKDDNSAYFLNEAAAVAAGDESNGGSGKKASKAMAGSPSSSLYSKELVGFTNSRKTLLGAAFGPFRVEHRAPQPDVSVQLLDSVVSINQPRVAGVFTVSAVPGRAGGDDGLPCYQLEVLYENSRFTAACQPDSQTGLCYAEVHLPLALWEQAARTGNDRVKVYYHAVDGPCSRSTGNLILETSQELRYVDEMQLEVVDPANPSLITDDDLVWIKIPDQPLAPNSRFFVPVYLSENVTFPEFIIRTRTRKGIRFLKAKVVNKKKWELTEAITKQESKVGVHVYSRAGEQRQQTAPSGLIFAFEFQLENITGDDQPPQQQPINWKIAYSLEGRNKVHTTRLVTNVQVRSSGLKHIVTEVQHDTILNTAVLNGRKVSQPLRVLSVSDQGRLQYITEDTQCSSLNSTVLKVDKNCGAVYLDGSEVSGLQRVGIQVDYRGFSTVRYFSVWVPQIPLHVELSDSRLSPIKGWKIPVETNGRSKSNERCRPRYQTSSIEVYTHFYTYNKSGAKKYLFDSKTLLRVTGEVLGQLHISNTSVAMVDGGKVVALTPGKSAIKVMPAAGSAELGSTVVEVSDERVSIQALNISLVTGMTLQMKETPYRRVYSVVTRAHQNMLAHHQEGMVEAILTFSDGVTTSLDRVHRGDYLLYVDSLTPSVVMATPGSATKSKIIALGEGQAQLLAELRPAKECQRSRRPWRPLATAGLRLNVSFLPESELHHLSGLMQGDQGRRPATEMENRASSLGGAGPRHIFPGVGSVDMGYLNADFDPSDLGDDLGDGTVGGTHHLGDLPPFPYDEIDGLGDLGGDGRHGGSLDDNQNRTSQVDPPPPVPSSAGLSPLYISLYSVLGIMCFAGFIGLIHCFLSATYYKKKHGLAAKSKTVCVSDWVWLSNKPRCYQDCSPQPAEAIPLRGLGGGGGVPPGMCPGCRLEAGGGGLLPQGSGAEEEEEEEADSSAILLSSSSNLSSRTPSTVIFVSGAAGDDDGGGGSVGSGSVSTLVSRDSMDLDAVLDVMRKQGDDDHYTPETPA